MNDNIRLFLTEYWIHVLIIMILYVSVMILIFICSEIDRRKGDVYIPFFEYYCDELRVILSPYNAWCGANSITPVTPFPEMEEYFPNHVLLTDNWKEIKEEALQVYGGGNAEKIKDDSFFRCIADDGWKRFYFKWYSGIDPKAKKLCPYTCSLIESLPEIRLAMFSILEPGSIIPPHAGPFRGGIRYHLGLQCSPEAFIAVDGKKYVWHPGHDILFDDTYHHEVQNRSDTTRIILFCDIERKMSSKFATKINKFICDYIAPITTRSNDKNETSVQIH